RGGHFGERLEAGGPLLLPLLVRLRGLSRVGLPVVPLPELLQRAVEVFLLLGSQFLTAPGLLVEFLDAVPVDPILALHDAAEGNRQAQQTARDGHGPQNTSGHFALHYGTSLSMGRGVAGNLRRPGCAVQTLKPPSISRSAEGVQNRTEMRRLAEGT